ncbi:MAG: DUF4097 family beta strand repeat-containing protein [Planctomycetota bacterium]
MKARYLLWTVLAGTALQLGSGCADGSQVSLFTSAPRVWTGVVTEDIRIDLSGLKRLDVDTYNGSLEHTCLSPGRHVAVNVAKKAGGANKADAQAALEAIEILVEDRGNGAKRVGWRWKCPRRHSWSAHVSFKTDAPASLAYGGETYNGDVDVTGMLKDVRVTTYNGSIRVQCAGPELSVESYNGNVKVDLTECPTLHGEIDSYNGDIRLLVAAGFSADLACETYNGEIKCEAPWQVRRASRRKLVGQIGAGGREVEITTYNGDIHIESAGE